MSDNTHAVADYASETYPEFSGKIQDTYIEGYDPVSFGAPHSSLIRTSTWVGMGLILSCLPAAGILIWGLGVWDTPLGTAGEGNYSLTIIIGIIALIAVAIAAVGTVHYGRRYYRKYRKETGRAN